MLPARIRPGRALAAVLAGIVLVAGGPASAARAATNEPANAATVLAARAYPGIQLIQTDYSATLSVPEVIVSQSALRRATQRLVAQALTGAIDRTTAGLREALVDQIVKNPFDFFKPSSTRQTTQSSLTAVGTGWVATPDGYIVTAAHVVKADPDEIKSEFAASALQKLAKAAISGLASGDSSGSYTADQLDRLGKAITQWYARYLQVSNVKTSVSVQVGVAVAGYKKSQRGQAVEIVSVGEPYPGKDVAILKLDGESQLPTLPVGTNEDVAEGSTLYVAGYPAASTFYSGLSKDSEVQPTVTQGPLTAIKSNANGTPVFQTQAPASPGNSGGPVLDADGKVVGILVASAVDDKGVALEGQGFVVPVSVVREKLRERNVTPRTGDTSTLYDEAIDAYYKHYYKRALERFQKVANLYPGHPYVGDFIARSQSAINAGKDETPLPGWVWLMVGFVVLLVLGAILGVVFLLLRRRRRGASLTASGAGQFPQQPGQQPYPPQQFPGQQFPGQQFPGQQYPGQPYPPQQFPGQQFPGQQFPGQEFSGQQYAPQPGQQPYPPQPYPGQPPFPEQQDPLPEQQGPPPQAPDQLQQPGTDQTPDQQPAGPPEPGR